MSELFLEILNVSIMAGWTVLAVLILRQLLKKAPVWVRCALWAVVGLRLIWPFHLESILSLIPSAQTLPARELYNYTPEVQTGVTVLDDAINPVFTEVFQSEMANSVNPLQVAIYICGGVWLLGVAVMAAYAIISYLRLRRQVGISLKVQENVYLCDRVQTPFILGIVKPKIYLPSNLPEEKWDSILAHERAHLARRDHWWKPLGFVLLAVHWFNPLLWLAYVLLCRDMEQACDERVIREMTAEEKKAYSQTLLECSVSTGRLSACPLAFGETGVKQRIKAVLHYKKPTLWLIIAAVVICGIAAVCFLTEPNISNSENNILTPFDVSTRYLISEVIYDDHSYFFTTDNTFLYDLTPYDQLKIYETDSHTHILSDYMTKISLSSRQFDDYFIYDLGWTDDMTASSLRQENQFAWKAEFDDGKVVTIYYILQQKNQDIYMFIGTRDVNKPEEDTIIHCGFELNTRIWGDHRTCNIWDQLHGDIDGDGRKETCYITGGPTSGIQSFCIIVKSNGELKYKNWFAGVARFSVNGWGKIQIVLSAREKDREVVVDVKIIDGRLVLYKDGEEFDLGHTE